MSTSANTTRSIDVRTVIIIATIVAAFALSAFLELVLARPTLAAETRSLPEYPTITTLAGSGRSGERDGPASQAEFIAPRGLAAASDGTLYVSDFAAHRIRSIDRAGNVTTFAGAQRPVVSAQYRLGGYVDGPADRATFNGPAGLALAPDGALIVADSRNHCLRRIAGGVVTTLAGSPSRAVAADGAGSDAAFREPLGVAAAHDGTLYVADFGAGLRSLDTTGRVTTISTLRDFTSVAVRERGASTDVFAFGDGGITVVHLPSGRSERIDAYADLKIQGLQRLGYAHGGIALDDTTMLFTDIRSQTIREAHLRGEVLGIGPSTRLIAGNPSNDSANDGDASRDGVGLDARFATPFGIVRLSDGEFAISDAAAHRVRRMSDYDHRWANQNLPTRRAPGEYRIAFVGTSYAWFDNDWTTSIEGLLEKRLTSEASALGLHARPRVFAFSFPAANGGAILPFVREELADGTVDAVVLEVASTAALTYLPDTHGDVLESIRTSAAFWRPKLIADFGGIAQVLASAHVPLVTFYHPTPYDYDAAESAGGQLPLELAFDRLGQPQTLAAFRAAIPDCVDETPRFEAASVAGIGPLFQTYAGHFAPLGRKLTADFVFDLLASRRPWK